MKTGNEGKKKVLLKKKGKKKTASRSIEKLSRNKRGGMTDAKCNNGKKSEEARGRRKEKTEDLQRTEKVNDEKGPVCGDELRNELHRLCRKAAKRRRGEKIIDRKRGKNTKEADNG